MSKTNTEGFAVIKWLDDNQFGIVAIKSIVSKKGEQVVVDKIYQVLYGNDHLQAQIKLLGSKDNCKQLLDSLTKSIVVQSAQKKSTTNAAKNKKSVEDSKRAKKKKPSSSQRGDRCDSTKSDNESNDADFADDSTKMTKTKSSKKANKAKAKPLPSNKAFSIDNNSIENDILKVKLSETSALLKEKEQLVSELTTKIANLTALNESYKNLISEYFLFYTRFLKTSVLILIKKFLSFKHFI
jgi:chemotaxis protein histidine kinase CheA